jgi:hypothetical protein
LRSNDCLLLLNPCFMDYSLWLLIDWCLFNHQVS